MQNKKKKTTRLVEVIGLPTGSIEKLRPIVSGNFDVVWNVDDFQPCIIQGAVRSFRLSPEEWAKVESATGQPINRKHREWINYACTAFIFACTHRDEIPSAKRYHKQLNDYAKNVQMLVSGTLANLVTKIDSKGYAQTSGKVTTAQEHLAAYAMQYWRSELESLIRLIDGLKALREAIKRQSPATNKGRDSHYELHHFFHTLYYVSDSAGIGKSISSRSDREIRALKRPTDLEKFARSILGILSDNQAGIVALYDLGLKQRERANTLLEKYLKKKNLIDDLMEARRRARGGKSLPKKWAQKLSN